MSEPEYKGFDWNAIDREGLAKAALLAGLKPEILLPSITSAPIPPVAKPVYDGDLNPDEVDALNPFLVKEMKTRGKVSAVDCLNSLIWVKRKNCFWTRTPEDRYGNREHRRKLIERWAREGRFDKLAQWVQAANLSDGRKKELLAICQAQSSRGRRLRARLSTPRG